MNHKDKILHFSICFIVGIFRPMLSVGLAIGKEYADCKASENHWCWWDMLANIIGIGLASIVRYFIF